MNGVQIRGQKTTLTEDVNEIKLGLCPKTLKYDMFELSIYIQRLADSHRIRWHPIVLSFSFTSKELRADPWTNLRDSLEQLDIKYSAEYEPTTTHVVSKKRNTSKGLQALINGRYIVTDSFINAIVQATEIPEGEEGASSALEQDFEANWPNPLDHLPPRGEEPGNHTTETYAPDARRQEVFDGYTFIFYEKKQYDNLFPAISAGKGKALLKEVVPNRTRVDEFVRYVKSVAGEKGLGSFEDGSEGKGVVVVRYTPKGEDSAWYAEFFTKFAQQLDHRPIDQKEFLEAILACDASMLRRPLEAMSQPVSVSASVEPQSSEKVRPAVEDRKEVEQSAPKQPQPSAEVPATEESAPAPHRRERRTGRSRFKGFDFDDDDIIIETPQAQSSTQVPALPQVPSASQDSLFVSQREPSLAPSEPMLEEEAPCNTRTTRQTHRKRVLSPLPEHDNSALLDEIAPITAAVKRRRIEAGQDPVPPLPEPEPEREDEDVEMVEESPPRKGKKGAATTARGKKKKIKQEDEENVLELARRRREEAEAAAAAERQRLAQLGDNIDYAAIRRLHIIEEIEVRQPEPHGPNRTREQDIADGRWDPRWNGRKNFKRFRRQGETGVRMPVQSVIVPLEEVRTKEYGIGDDYWLEDEEGRVPRRPKETQTQERSTIGSVRDGSGFAAAAASGKGKEKEKENEKEVGRPGSSAAAAKQRSKPAPRRTVLTLDSSDEDEDEPSPHAPGIDTISDSEPEVVSSFPSVIPASEPSRSRAAKAAERANALRSSAHSSQSPTQQHRESQLSTGSSKIQLTLAPGSSSLSFSRSGTAAGRNENGKRPFGSFVSGESTASGRGMSVESGSVRGESASKRQKQGSSGGGSFLATRRKDDGSEEESEDDELKFRFGRRR